MKENEEKAIKSSIDEEKHCKCGRPLPIDYKFKDCGICRSLHTTTAKETNKKEKKTKKTKEKEEKYDNFENWDRAGLVAFLTYMGQAHPKKLNEYFQEWQHSLN